MPLEGPLPQLNERVARLNGRYRHHAATDVLANALTDPMTGRAALVSSFGAESVVLLHMVSVIDRTTPVMFLETGMLFPETLTYQQEVAEILGLTDVRIIRPDPADILLKDTDGILHQADVESCCALRKTRPLGRALANFDAWITGRKRFQGGAREGLPIFEADENERIKINPLAHWTPEDIKDYMENNRLPRHPLVAKGYPSLGCAPCTTPTREDENPRAGRWRGTAKSECGIHLDADKKTLAGRETV